MCQPIAPEPTEAATSPAHQEGKCPCCGKSNLSYGDSGLQDGGYYYKWTCDDCDATGTEWYNLVFSEHHIQSTGDTAETE